MSKTRKQHIENLQHLLTQSHAQDFYKSAQYAIDHLSREWVSRKHHREKTKRLEECANEYMRKSVDFERENRKLEAEIDHLKADKDRLQSNWDIAREANSERIKEVGKLNYLIYTLESDLKEESDKVSEGKKIIIWLSITTVILTIVLIISLFN